MKLSISKILKHFPSVFLRYKQPESRKEDSLLLFKLQRFQFTIVKCKFSSVTNCDLVFFFLAFLAFSICRKYKKIPCSRVKGKITPYIFTYLSI